VVTIASTDTLFVATANSNEPPASAFMTLDTRNAHLVLDADDTTDEECVFSGVMPQNFTASGGLTIKIHFMATTATSGNAVLQAAIETEASLDRDADSFAAFQSSGAVAVNGTSGIESIATVTMTNAQADSVAAGDAFRIKIRRDADDTSATDSVTGDLEIVEVEIRET